MDECLKLLEKQQECLNDEILAQQVRLQLITDKLNFGPYHGGLAATPDPIQAPPAFYLHSMHAQLRSIQPRVAPNSQSHSGYPSFVTLIWIAADVSQKFYSSTTTIPP